MSIHVALHHVTRYRYDRLVRLGPQIVRLRPAPHCRTPVLSYSMKVEPAQHFVNWQQDPFANYMARLVFPERTRTLEIAIDLVAEMSVYNPFDFSWKSTRRPFRSTMATHCVASSRRISRAIPPRAPATRFVRISNRSIARRRAPSTFSSR